MSDVVSPGKTVTFTVTKRPRRTPQVKTIQRLMRMQPDIQRGLKALQKRRDQTDNDPRRRAGLIWIHRKRATRLTRVEPGETFTLRITPQVMPDLASVLEFLEAAGAA